LVIQEFKEKLAFRVKLVFKVRQELRESQA
jgi:hypothetical protein